MVCGHGSRDEGAVAEFEKLSIAIRERAGDIPVEYGFLEFATPVIKDGLAKLADQGVTDVLAVPGMLFAAGHAKNDIPSVLNTWASGNDGVDIRYGRELAIDLKMLRAAADRIEEAASVKDEQDLYQAQLDIFLDPNDPEVIEQARKDGVPEAWLESARKSPVYKMAMEWKVAFPLHPEYRTLPMVWYVPPLSPINAAASAGQLDIVDGMPDVRSLRIPLRYLANLLTAGKEEPVALCLERMMAMRSYMRAKTIDGVIATDVAERVGLTPAQIDEMYHIMAIANYEDRFVIPTSHREEAEDAFDERGACGFSFGNGCSGGSTETNLFGSSNRKKIQTPSEVMGS